MLRQERFAKKKWASTSPMPKGGLREPVLTEKRRLDGRVRPWKNSGEVLNGVLWVLRTGAPWKDLPDRYPPY